MPRITIGVDNVVRVDGVAVADIRPDAKPWALEALVDWLDPGHAQLRPQGEFPTGWPATPAASEAAA